MIPILLNHDAHRVIGHVETIERGFRVRFSEDVEITRDMFFDIFGCGATFDVLTKLADGRVLIRQATIIEFSLCARPSARVAY